MYVAERVVVVRIHEMRSTDSGGPTTGEGWSFHLIGRSHSGGEHPHLLSAKRTSHRMSWGEPQHRSSVN
jgi:hypothetical protein